MPPTDNTPLELLVLKPTIISLLKRGAVRKPGIYKSEVPGMEESIEIGALCKWDDEEGILRAIAYPPNEVDAHGHWAGPPVLKGACAYYMKLGCPLDRDHNLTPLEKTAAFVSECSILQAGDLRYDPLGKTEGAWGLTVNILSEDLREEARAGNLNELSLFAPRDNYELSKNRPPILKTQPHAAPLDDENIMTPEQLAELQKTIADGNKQMLEGLTKTLQDAVKPADPAPETEAEKAAKAIKEAEDLEKSKAPTLKKAGPVPTEGEIQEYRKEVAYHDLAKQAEGVDWNDDSATKEFLTKKTELDQKYETGQEGEGHLLNGDDTLEFVSGGASAGSRKPSTLRKADDIEADSGGVPDGFNVPGGASLSKGQLDLAAASAARINKSRNKRRLG